MQAQAQKLGPQGGIIFSYAIEPFVPQYLSYNKVLGGTAYPWDRSKFFSPFNIYFAWVDPRTDAAFTTGIRESAKALVAAAKALGQTGLDNVPLYPNYADGQEPITKIYGSGTTLIRLKLLKARIDPYNVMGLAGGFKITV